MTARTERIDALLRAEISEVLQREVHDPYIGFATVTDVETSPDLRHARVWMSVMGQPGEQEETLRALQRAMPFVRRRLGERLRLRRIPELTVRHDETAERGTRVLRILRELEEGHVPEGSGLDEGLPTPFPPAAEEPAREGAARHRRPARRGG